MVDILAWYNYTLGLWIAVINKVCNIAGKVAGDLVILMLLNWVPLIDWHGGVRPRNYEEKKSLEVSLKKREGKREKK